MGLGIAACGGAVERQPDEGAAGASVSAGGSTSGGGRIASAGQSAGGAIGSVAPNRTQPSKPQPSKPMAGEGGVGGAPAEWSGGAPAYGGGSVGDPVMLGEGGASGCHFEYLGDWIRCEGDDNYPWSKEVPNSKLADCVQACLADAACTAIVDYYYLPPSDPLPLCVLDVSPCRHPTTNVWAQEDAGKEYRKVCD
jgi:hypothetical protein